ncbi:YihY family inner membrane protein [Ideonella sp. BN130291]|uniref:YihY family inner membrane protein n=1 Tax=Ideonella sp. BN130291 TaxID=3112940 RepID=UPI002E268679|nr:YihY family inner membrane protein [Ideonella sp. BN130291]
MTVPPLLKTATWKEAVAFLLRTLRTWPWFDTLRTLRLRFREDRLGLTASSLTFTTLIALVPLLTVMLAVFSAFPMFGNFRGALEKYFLQSLVPDTIAKPVLGALTQFAAKASRLGSVGLVVLVFTAIALMLTIDRTLNGIWRVRSPRPIAQRVLVYWAAVTLGPLVLGVSLSLTSYAVTASNGLVGAMPGSLSVLLGLLQFGMLTAAIAGLFHYVPNTLVLWRHALAGGLFVSVGFEIAKRALAWYVQSVPTYSTIYGAFATVPIFLVWLYLGWVIVLLGAVVAAYAPSLQMRVVRRPSTPGHRFVLAVAVLRELAAARRSQTHGVSITDLAQRLRTEPLQIEPILDTLVAMDWAARLDEAGAQRHVLLCEPTTTPARPLMAQLLLQPAPELGRFWHQAGFENMTLKDLLEN